MNGDIALRGAVIRALRADSALMALVNSVEDGSNAKYSAPALILGDLFATQWGARGVYGMSVRLPFTLVDRADRPGRLADAAARIAAVLVGLPPDLPDWRITSLSFDRSRSVRAADGQWSMMIDYLVRLARAD